VIFCSGYTNLELIVTFLSVLKENNVNVELIVSHNDYIKIFRKHFRSYYNHLWSLWEKPQYFKKLYNMRGISLEKKHLKELIKKINYKMDSRIIFFGRDYVSRDIYLLNYLKQNNQIFYLETGHLLSSNRDLSPKGIIKEKILRFIYGNAFTYQKFGDDHFTRIAEFFFENVKMFSISNEDIANVFRVKKLIKVKSSIKVIFFDAPYFPGGRNDSVHLLKLRILKKLNSILDKKNIGLKFHPGRDVYKNVKYLNQISELGIEIATYLPSELIDYNKCSLAIGFGSYSLSKRSIGSTPAICLTKLVNWDKNTEKQILNQLKNSNENLFFPQDYEELEKYINNFLSKL